MEPESPSSSKDKPMGLWASPRSQMDNPVSMDGFTRPDDLFNGFSELMNFDTYAGWCSSPSADQMLASFALSAGYSPFLPTDGEDFPTPDPHFCLPLNSADHGDGGGTCQQNSPPYVDNVIFYKPPKRPLAEKMLKALSLFKESSGGGILAQVWVPIKDGDKYILSTFEQPYLLDQMLAGYREVSRGFTFSTSTEAKPGTFPGLPGRVFTSKVPEWTSNVAHYHKSEYLRIDYALSHEVRGSIAVPIFEHNSCCAVLELVTMKEKSDFNLEIDHVCRALEMVDLKSIAPPRLYKQCLSKNQLAALAEITDVLRAVCHAHRLPVALTWIPCSYSEGMGDEIVKVRVRGGNTDPSDKCILCIESGACYVNDREMQGFVQACSEHHLEEGQGIAGKALQSNHPFFFPDVKEYDISQYPLVQHARKHGLSAAVAIRLRSTFTGDDDYILEFFLPVNMKGCTEQQLLLNNLSGTMQRICRSLRTVSDAELYVVGFDGGSDGSRRPVELSSGSERKCGDESSTQVSADAIDSSDVRMGVRPPEQMVGGSRRQSEKKRTPAEKNVSLSVLQQYFSGSLKDAAKSIGVCPTTLKRICRQHGISRWPSRKINKVNRSLKKIQTVLDSVQGVEGGLKFDPTTGGLVAAGSKVHDLDAPRNSALPNQDPPPASVKSEDDCHTGPDGLKPSAAAVPWARGCDQWSPSQVDDGNQTTSSGMTDSSSGGSMMNGSSSSSHSEMKRPKTEAAASGGGGGSRITVKATYRDDTVRFKFEPRFGCLHLYEQVAKRFELPTGTFQLKYKDDEDEWVLLVCDSDLHECLEILEFLGTRNVKFLVRDAPFPIGSSGSSNCFLMGSA